MRLTRSTFTAALNDSACALSKHTPVRPTERRIPSAAVLLANACEVYCETLNAGSSSDVLGPILVHPVSQGACTSCATLTTLTTMSSSAYIHSMRSDFVLSATLAPTNAKGTDATPNTSVIAQLM